MNEENQEQVNYLRDLRDRILKYLGFDHELQFGRFGYKRPREDMGGCSAIDFLKIIKYCEVVRFAENITIERSPLNIYRNYRWSVVVHDEKGKRVVCGCSRYKDAFEAAQNIQAKLIMSEEQE